MAKLTARQAEVLEFIETARDAEGAPPSLREIAARFGFRSPNAARDHVRALERKGALTTRPGRARGIGAGPGRPRTVRIPRFGTVPAGFAEGREQDAEGCVVIDLDTLGFTPGPRTFALQVRGDSMVGRHILDGDIVICEHGRTPRHGDVVAALIDHESTLKTFVREGPRARAWLRAENPAYPRLLPAAELVIQGVVVGLVRRRI